MKLWTVVCTDLHNSVGPVTSKSLATIMAMMMTKEGGDKGCVYVPVPMEFLGIVAEADSIEEVKAFREARKKKNDKSDKDERYGGQYL